MRSFGKWAEGEPWGQGRALVSMAGFGLTLQAHVKMHQLPHPMNNLSFYKEEMIIEDVSRL